jgi:glycosyltransferase involved in cell wall biosynthesis
MDVLVSVLMVVYNHEKLVTAAIESVLSSTYKNFELIVVDDRSQDNTYQIANEYTMLDPRVRVYLNEQNLGDYPNRSKAASYANGKYLKFVDGDDLIYPWGLEILVNMMEQFPEAGWGLCSLIQNEKKIFPFVLSPKETYEYEYFGTGLFHKAPLSSIIKKDAFEKVGGFASIRMAGDFEMWNKLAQKFPLVLMPDGIVWHRVHAQQESKVLAKSYFNYHTTYEKYKKQYLEDVDCPLDKKQAAQAIKATKRKLLKNILKSIAFLNPKMFVINFTKLMVYCIKK